MELFASHPLLDWFGLKEILRLVFLSGLFVMIALLMFPRNAPTRRLLILGCAIVLLVAPVLLYQDWFVLRYMVEQVPEFDFKRSIPAVLFAIWTVGALTLILRRVVVVNKGTAKYRQLPIATAVQHSPALHSLSSSLAIDVNVQVRCSRKLSAPCSFTLGENTIVLPHSYDEWNDNSLATVLAHELVHISRQDDRWLLFIGAVCDWYWWMPWLRWLQLRYLQSMEESCDDAACELLKTQVGYAQGVVAVARHSVTLRSEAEDSANWALPNLLGDGVLKRISRLSEQRHLELNTQGAFWLFILVLSAGFLGTGVELVGKPQSTVAGMMSSQTPLVRLVKVPAKPAAHTNLLPITPLVTVTGTTEEPIFVTEQAPIYPGSAINHGIEGDVWVEYVVADDGSISRVKVIAASPPQVFEQAVLRALAQSAYQPRHRRQQTADWQPIKTATISAQPQTQRQKKRFSFRLEAH